jgi:hypothetical protein
VQLDFNITHFSQFETAIKGKPKLSVGETIVSAVPLESGIARGLPSLHSPKESTKCLVQPVSHILKNLGVDVVKTGAFLFKLSDSLALFEIRKRFSFLLPSISTFFKQLVIQPATFIKLGLQKISLMLGGIESIFKGFVHYKDYILNEGGCQADSSHP